MISLISIQTIISDYMDRTDVPAEKLDDTILLNFATSAVQKLYTPKQKLHKVVLLNVSNYNAPMPDDFYSIVEVAFKGDMNIWNAKYRDEVVEYTGKNFADCDIKVRVTCPKCHDHKCSCGDNNVNIFVDDDWIKANMHREYWHSPYYRGVHGVHHPVSFYHPKFSLMRPAQHNFFGTNYHVPNCVNLDSQLLADCPYEYKIENKRIRTNQECGAILMSYMANQTDEDGYPMIPDDPDVFEAVFWDIEAKMMYRAKKKDKNNYQLSMNARQLAEQYFVRAKEKLEAISPLEWNAIVRNYLRKNVPYTDFASQASRPLADQYNKGRSMTRT